MSSKNMPLEHQFIYLNNSIALDYLLAKQGGVYTLANASYYMINNPAIIETQIHEIKTPFV